jgi:hypothetical protein
MGSNPINLAFRFLLELTTLFALGKWGWSLSANWMSYILAVAFPAVAMVIWAVFAVADDPSRSGASPVPVSGIARLLIEFTFFGIGAWALYTTGQAQMATDMAILVVLHYLISYDRIIWLWTK